MTRKTLVFPLLAGVALVAGCLGYSIEPNRGHISNGLETPVNGTLGYYDESGNLLEERPFALGPKEDTDLGTFTRAFGKYQVRVECDNGMRLNRTVEVTGERAGFSILISPNGLNLVEGPE
ncbi:MAG TPA: hypothetical protein VNZ52_05025 [Candidatus Thermoplasmatota archaeon]|nr:hypothetical protein [Candidatus Thermoplasmatota archaeon]